MDSTTLLDGTDTATVSHTEHDGDSYLTTSGDPLQYESETTTELPTITVNDRQLPDVTSDVLSALLACNDPPTLFARDGQPVGLRTLDDGRLAIKTMNDAAVRGRIARSARFVIADKKGAETQVSPPGDVVRDLMALDLHEHGFPILNAVTEIPVMRPDWSVITEPGYDAATRLYYAPSPALNIPPIPDQPDAVDVARAVELIDEAIGEFPYEADADRANAIATLLTPFIRPTIDLSPIAIFDAPQAGTGKSLLAAAQGKIVTGGDVATFGASEDDAEMRKLITTTLLDGPTIILIDNIEGTLRSPSLARALTSPVWGDRILGANKKAALPQRVTWIATGNNVRLGGDLPRRCYRIRLDAKTSRPWKGREFRHPNLMEWIGENRGSLIAAMLTICRAWHVAGRPVSKKRVTLGSFEQWSNTLSDILDFAGVDGFLQNLEHMYEEADDDAAEWEAFLEAWSRQYGEDEIPVKRIVDDLTECMSLRDSLPEEIGNFIVFQPDQYGGGKFSVKDVGRVKNRLGLQLRQRAGRRYGDRNLFLQRSDDTHAKTALWSVRGGLAGSDRVEEWDDAAFLTQ